MVLLELMGLSVREVGKACRAGHAALVGALRTGGGRLARCVKRGWTRDAGGRAAKCIKQRDMDAQRTKMIIRLKEDKIARLQARQDSCNDSCADTPRSAVLRVVQVVTSEAGSRPYHRCMLIHRSPSQCLLPSGRTQASLRLQAMQVCTVESTQLYVKVASHAADSRSAKALCMSRANSQFNASSHQNKQCSPIFSAVTHLGRCHCTPRCVTC